MADIEALFPALDHRDPDGVLRTSLTFSINLFAETSFLAIPDAVLRCQELFLQLGPRDKLRFYATENMRKHRPVNAKVFGMLELWLRAPQPKDDIVALELKDGDDVRDAPKYMFNVFSRETGAGGEPSSLANTLNLAFPPEFGTRRADEVFELTRRLAEIIPYQCGSAGFAFHCSRYSPEIGEAFAWQKSMRHPEVDIVRPVQDRHAVERNAVKTVGWLTLVSDALLDELGGASAVKSKLGNGIDVVKAGGGRIFRIGPAPALCDRNRGESASGYRALHVALRPLIERAGKQSPWFKTGGEDRDEQTEAWFQRFEKP
ncbi:MAG: DUF3396 domain-containing protein [Burkholderiaceae bacterium]|nr:DUF3396 domain-containing protein [Burkholderiaceae bacterium]